MQRLTKQLIENFVMSHKSTLKTLDVGCGDRPYQKYFPNSTGLDVTESAGVVKGSAMKLPFKAKTFDNVLMTEVLEHIEDPRRAISEARRVLKPNGYLFLTTRALYPIHQPPDYWRFTPESLSMLFRDWEYCRILPEHAFSEMFHHVGHTQNHFKKPLLYGLSLVIKPLNNILPVTGFYIVAQPKRYKYKGYYGGGHEGEEECHENGSNAP